MAVTDWALNKTDIQRDGFSDKCRAEPHHLRHPHPSKNNDAATGRFGPSAPPRDALTSIGNLMECFQF
jgi:hypothetical protein